MAETSRKREIAVEAHGSFATVRELYARGVGLEDAPFLSPAWLGALEDTGCVVADRGWVPHHLVIKDGAEPIAVAPAYLKLNSEGEFVFDHGWANAAHRAGIDYYPKLLVAVPFTPATSQRIVSMPGADPALARPAFVAALEAIVERAELSSAHVLFSRAEEAESLAALGMIHRHGVQFHWQNRGYDTFEAFLADLPSKRRTQIRREMRAPKEQGIEIETLAGEQLTPEIADVAYELYLTTVDKFIWGRRYLTRAFFEEVMRSMRDAVELVVAREEGSPKIFACAFNLRGEHALFGRYWGAFREVPFLHFNVCYYHSIERAIALGLDRFEPGAGGEHKLSRGFLPTVTHSTHLVRDARLGVAVRDFCARERRAIAREVSSETR
ncbi:MAG TPA: GNAT family N-acetyltransferase [Polyangiaceae bacterium]|jgi:predicted N-acyltransferase|nr:GNAT family N-acetyltransferase [Polyangiaceae bacterium]